MGEEGNNDRSKNKNSEDMIKELMMKGKGPGYLKGWTNTRKPRSNPFSEDKMTLFYSLFLGMWSM